MPERSFGRTIRYRRTKIGLSQAQLGELVGRSASSIRSWERDFSTPTDPAVLTALSAILDVDGRSLFDKAGVPMPEEEAHPTVEEALASLAPLPLEEPIEDEVAADPVVEATAEAEPERASASVEPDADFELESEVHEHLEEAAFPSPVDQYPEQVEAHPPEGDDQLDRSGEPSAGRETFSLPAGPSSRREALVAGEIHNPNEPAAFVAPPEPYVITAPTPPVVEPSYMEDANQRQLYRVRNLATVVFVVVLVIVLLWSLSNTLEAIGMWWDEFVGSLRL